MNACDTNERQNVSLGQSRRRPYIIGKTPRGWRLVRGKHEAILPWNVSIYRGYVVPTISPHEPPGDNDHDGDCYGCSCHCCYLATRHYRCSPTSLETNCYCHALKYNITRNDRRAKTVRPRAHHCRRRVVSLLSLAVSIFFRIILRIIVIYCYNSIIIQSSVTLENNI